MRRFLLILLMGLWAFVQTAFTAPVDVQTARTVATHFYFERFNIQGHTTMEEITWDEVIPVSRDGVLLYYIFNHSQGKGWVAVSADDRTIPVMSYTFKGTYGQGEKPPAFVEWMKAYEDQILNVIENDFPRSEEATALWEGYIHFDIHGTKSTLAVSPLLGTIYWGQGCYFNAQCPTHYLGDCGRVPTGCVATAMAMIMKKHAYPTHGFSSHSYTHSTYGVQSANFGTATYGWASMPNSVSSSNTEVAEIMRHCGVAVDMDYNVAGSGAYLSDATAAFKTYFIYAATYAYKASYSDADWKLMLKEDLDLGRPILYAGQATGGGHAFVCDGYQGTSNDHFHFNWGWEGAYNSYNYLDYLVPGNNTGNGNYTSYQEAVVHIYPDPATLPVANFSASYTSLPANNFTTLVDQSQNDPLIWSWTITPSAGTSFVGGTTSASKSPKVAFTIPGQYTVSMTCTNSAGSDTETKNNYITVTSGAGMDDPEAASVVLYPNPVSDLLVITKPTGAFPQDSRIALYSSIGSLVAAELPWEQNGDQLRISLGGFPEGVYMMSFRSSSLNFTRRLVLMH